CSSGSPGELIVNGMSGTDRSGSWSNTALIGSVNISSWPEALVVREQVERNCFLEAGMNYDAPAQTVRAFQNSVRGDLPASSYRPGLASRDLTKILPPPLVTMLHASLGRLSSRLRGVNDGLLIAPESRVTPPYRYLRDKTGFVAENIMFIGEGSGFASGISTSAMDGMRVAMNFVHGVRGGKGTTTEPE
ncbi:hypothetical protein KKF84_18085, partial [Myxococcota bacterium]|nr:hypothetical protein [Myxococcota bacterium]